MQQSSLPPNASSKPPSTPQEAHRAADLAAAESLTEGDSAQPPDQKPTLPSKHPRADNKPTQADALDNLTNTTTKPKRNQADKPEHPHASELILPPPTYHVTRSGNNFLPVYTDFKRGGNLHLTAVRKITGDLAALRDELRDLLGKKDEDVTINPLTRQVLIKGHHKKQVQEFLIARGF